jgi:hypothetical protein
MESKLMIRNMFLDYQQGAARVPMAYVRFRFCYYPRMMLCHDSPVLGLGNPEGMRCKMP